MLTSKELRDPSYFRCFFSAIYLLCNIRYYGMLTYHGRHQQCDHLEQIFDNM